MLGTQRIKGGRQPPPSGSSRGRSGEAGSGKAHWGPGESREGVKEELGASGLRAECVGFSGPLLVFVFWWMRGVSAAVSSRRLEPPENGTHAPAPREGGVWPQASLEQY